MKGEQAIQDAQRLAEVRQTVREKYPDIKFPTPVKEPVWVGRINKKIILGKHAVIDSDNRHVFNIVSNIYKIVTHEEVIFNTLESLDKFVEYGKPEIEIVLGGEYRSRMFLTIVFPEVEQEIKSGDVVNPRYILKNSYDSSWRLKTSFGAFRVVCSNGMTIGKKILDTSNKHTMSLDVDGVFKKLEAGMKSFSNQTSLWSRWAETQIELPKVRAVFDQLPFSEAEQERINDKLITGSDNSLKALLEGNSATVWDFNNALTEFVTHDIQSDNRRVELEEKVGVVMQKSFSTLSH